MRFAVTRRGRCGGCAGRGPAAGARRAVQRLQRHRRRCGRARGHMVFRKACSRCDGTGAANFAPCPACARGRAWRCARMTVAVAVPAGVQDGERLARCRAKATPAAAARRRAISTSPCTSTPIRASGARATTCTSTCRWRSTKRRSGPASTCRRRAARAGCACRRARSRASSSASASAACRRRGRGRTGDLVATVRLVLPPLNDEQTRTLIRSLAAAYPDDVRAWQG